MTRKKILHQFSEGVAPGDAITDQMLAIRQWLRDAGYTSEIFAASIHPALVGEVGDVLRYRPQAGERQAIYHHSIGSDVVDTLCALAQRLLLIYHNVTPPDFFQQTDPRLAEQLRRGVAQLSMLRAQTELALGVSSFNASDLRQAGFERVGILPLPLNETDYQLADDSAVLATVGANSPYLLYVGRLAPNKRQEDLLKLLYYYRRIEPRARLVLVGSLWASTYVRWLRDLAQSLGLEDAVTFTGHVSQQAMVTYYRHAALYVSMSEHEGFGKPLIESMLLDLPVLAYASSGVPETLGGAGILFREKNFEAMAEFVDLLIQDIALRRKIIARQQVRAGAFLASAVRADWQRYLDSFWNGNNQQ